MALPADQHVLSEKAPIIPSSPGGSGKEKNNVVDEKQMSRGLTFKMAALFLCGEMTGSGIVSLPKAIDNTGVFGMFMLPAVTLLLTYTGRAIALNWSLIQERYPEYRGHVRDPYAVIGHVTYGRPGWFAGFGGTITAILAGALLLASTIYERVEQGNVTVQHANLTWSAFPMAAGTMFYAYSCHSIFPTVQTDMRDQHQFINVVFVSFTATFLTYYPLSLAGYFVFGKRTTDNYLLTPSPGPMTTTAQIMVSVHYMCAFLICINPVCQQLEQIFNIPVEFNWRRCVMRTLFMAIGITIAMLVPSFGVMVSLVGGSMLNVLAIICPVMFYLKLCAMEGDWKKITLGYGTRLFCYFILMFGVVSGFSCTYMALEAIIEQRQTIPPTNASLSNR